MDIQMIAIGSGVAVIGLAFVVKIVIGRMMAGR
jgi:hypothetical protein